MKISRKCEYALRALIDLAVHYDKGVRQINDISHAESIPGKFLEQILLQLKNAGFLNSRRGIRGGYSLKKAPQYITIGEVVRSVDGPLAPIGCVSKTEHVSCAREKRCGLRSVMLDVRNAIAEILDNITLRDVCNRIKVINRLRHSRR